MTAEVTIEGLDEVRKYTQRMPEVYFDSAKEAYNKVLLIAHAKVTQRATAGPLFRRTGELARSLRSKVTGLTLERLSGSLYSTSKYAPVHEYGAEGVNRIKAKNAYGSLPGGPYLNIPSHFNKTAAGVMRLSARDVFARGGFIIPLSSPRARYAVMLEQMVFGNTIVVDPMFWLVKSVEIPPRLGMRDTAKGEIPTLLSELSRSLEREMKND